MSLWQEGHRVIENVSNDPHTPREAVGPRAAVALRRSAYPELSLVCCDFDEGTLTLRGHVSSYYLKQMAQNLVWKLEGVRKIDNQLVVAPSASRVRATSDRFVAYSTIRRHPH